MRYIKTRFQNHFYVFENTADLVEFTEDGLFKQRDPSFVGMTFDSWDDVIDQSQQTWDYGAEVIESFVERLQVEEIKALKSRERKSQWSKEEGDEMDWEKMMAGEDFWKTTKRENREGPGEITIIADTSTPYDKDSEDILWRGGVALALTRILEERGYKVELWATNGSRLFAGEREGVMTAVCLKHPGESFDMSNLCNTLSGWFYRSAVFSTLETICKVEGKEPAIGYGSCFIPTEVDLDSLTPDYHRIFISEVFTFSSAVDVVVNQVARLAMGSDEFSGQE